MLQGFLAQQKDFRAEQEVKEQGFEKRVESLFVKASEQTATLDTNEYEAEQRARFEATSCGKHSSSVSGIRRSCKRRCTRRIIGSSRRKSQRQSSQCMRRSRR